MSYRFHAPKLGGRTTTTASPPDHALKARGLQTRAAGVPAAGALPAGAGTAGHALARIRIDPEPAAAGSSQPAAGTPARPWRGAAAAAGPIQLGNGKKGRKKKSSLPKSTIKYAEGIEEAADIVGVKDLATRKPHTKLGTGSGGTQHDVADARAATLASERVEEAIEKKTGVKQSISSFLKQTGKEAATAVAASEKKQERARKAQEIAAEDQEHYKDWIASLAPDTWTTQQEDRGNTYRKAPPAKQVKKLAKKAKEQGWETTWNEEEMAAHLSS